MRVSGLCGFFVASRNIVVLQSTRLRFCKEGGGRWGPERAMLDFRQAVYEPLCRAMRIALHVYLKVQGASAYCGLQPVVCCLAPSETFCRFVERAISKLCWGTPFMA